MPNRWAPRRWPKIVFQNGLSGWDRDGGRRGQQPLSPIHLLAHATHMVYINSFDCAVDYTIGKSVNLYNQLI